MVDGQELNGWGEIADHLGVSVRTAQVYERDLGLPVRRRPGARGRVWALATELDVWKAGPTAVNPLHIMTTPVQTSRGTMEPRNFEYALSSKLRSPLAGHKVHALVGSTIYAMLLALVLPLEIAYAYDLYVNFTWIATLLVLMGVFATTYLALAVDLKITRAGRDFGLAASIGILILSGSATYLAVRPGLPAYPLTQASFQTWTAQAAYLKTLVYSVAFAVVFVSLSFHFVIAMQRELSAGEYNRGFELLTNSSQGIAPPGAPYLPPWLFGVLLLAGAIYSILSAAHLLEALKVTKFSNLFIHLIEFRWILFLALGMECCWWYYSAINELKRECAQASKVSASVAESY